MSLLTAPGAAPTAGGFPELLFSGQNLTNLPFIGTYENTIHNSLVVVTGIDATCTETEPIQCYADYAYHSNSIVFFHDSQSTGEGLGVTFPWRGAIPLAYNQSVIATLTSSGAISKSIVIWGYRIPWLETTP